MDHHTGAGAAQAAQRRWQPRARAAASVRGLVVRDVSGVPSITPLLSSTNEKAWGGAGQNNKRKTLS
jgi:hypothetical protein